MHLKKQSNKVLKLIDNAVVLHSKINNYHNYISLSNKLKILLFILKK